MNSNNQSTIEALHKVTLTLTPEPPVSDNAAPTTVTLIVGLGVTGMTLIEQQLIGRKVGETFGIDLTSGCWEATMAPIPSTWAHEAPQHVIVTITATQPAEPREVVKAMAISNGGCGCSGGGDCDCCDH